MDCMHCNNLFPVLRFSLFMLVFRLVMFFPVFTLLIWLEVIMIVMVLFAGLIWALFSSCREVSVRKLRVKGVGIIVREAAGNCELEMKLVVIAQIDILAAAII